jgi:RNA polymerase sigma-70 factor (sigma-E family)
VRSCAFTSREALQDRRLTGLSARRDTEFTQYLAARQASLRRVAFLLCQDWDRADDLVQGAITRLYVHWNRAREVEHVDAYARAILVREFLNERRSPWARRVTLPGRLPDLPGAVTDDAAALDVRTSLATLPPRQRAVLVLRFYCDLSVDQAARVLGCSPGTVKSQTAKGLDSLRRVLDPVAAPGPGGGPGTSRSRRASEERA